jgi:hypothetical protein
VTTTSTEDLPRRLLAWSAASVLLFAVPAMMPTGAPSGSSLTVAAPAETTRASVIVEGSTTPGALVAIENGALPVETAGDAAGRFRADVPLRPDTPNALAVTAVWAGGRADATVTVRQIDGQPNGVLRGQVFDSATGEPGQGVHIRYGAVSTTTDSAGGFELHPVPDGTVVAVVDKPDHLPRLASAVVADGQGGAGPTLIQRMAPAQIVGPAGDRFSGTGWDVDIPPGALDEPTALRVTPLQLSGSVEAYGAPIIDIAPDDLRFRKPMAITVSAAMIGLDPQGTQVRGFDPETLTSRRFATTVTGGRLRFEISDVRGEEIRLQPDLAANQSNTDLFCKPYTNTADLLAGSRYVTSHLPIALRLLIGPASFRIWSEYLTPGHPSLDRLRITDPKALREFQQAGRTRDAALSAWQELRHALEHLHLPLGPPDRPTTRQLSDFPSLMYPPNGVGQFLPIDWDGPIFSAPANLAGGVGGAHIDTGPAGGLSIADERHITGPVRLVPHATDKGVRTRVTLEADFTLRVLDAVDFCPGGTGQSLEREFTVPMSRLEVTPHPDGGTYAKPTLFEVEVGLDTARFDHDITDFYPTNDFDGDGVPDAQPWNGASYRLDDCPEIADPGQEDGDQDGIGDACDGDPGSLRGTLTYRKETTWKWKDGSANRWSWAGTYRMNLKYRDGQWNGTDLPGNTWNGTFLHRAEVIGLNCDFTATGDGSGAHDALIDPGGARLGVEHLTGEVLTTEVGSSGPEIPDGEHPSGCYGTSSIITPPPTLTAGTGTLTAGESGRARFTVNDEDRSVYYGNPSVDADGMLTVTRWTGELTSG